MNASTVFLALILILSISMLSAREYGFSGEEEKIRFVPGDMPYKFDANGNLHLDIGPYFPGTTLSFKRGFGIENLGKQELVIGQLRVEQHSEAIAVHISPDSNILLRAGETQWFSITVEFGASAESHTFLVVPVIL
ncbi:MAG: hypothetical protein ACPL1Y_01135 [Thermoplasmata archaeon]